MHRTAPQHLIESDARERELERLAVQGDQEAARALLQMQSRFDPAKKAVFEFPKVKRVTAMLTYAAADFPESSDDYAVWLLDRMTVPQAVAVFLAMPSMLAPSELVDDYLDEVVLPEVTQYAQKILSRANSTDPLPKTNKWELEGPASTDNPEFVGRRRDVWRRERLRRLPAFRRADNYERTIAFTLHRNHPAHLGTGVQLGIEFFLVVRVNPKKQIGFTTRAIYWDVHNYQEGIPDNPVVDFMDTLLAMLIRRYDVRETMASDIAEHPRFAY